MSIAQSLVPEFDSEASITRRRLERTPPAAADWKPHEKSMSLGRLAAHLAEIPSWGTMLQMTMMDFSPEGNPYVPPTFSTTEELLAIFDRNVQEARAVLGGLSDADYGVTWTLLASGQTILSMPRIAVARTWVLNHLVHHRGQYSVYLRLQGIPVPSIYGPSADEQG